MDQANPRNSNLAESRTRTGVYGNRDVMTVFMRIELEGLTTCTKAQPADPCAGKPFFPCERCMVEESLGKHVDPRWPDDLAIARALQIEAEFRDYQAIDRDKDILAADLDDRLLTKDEVASLSPAEQFERSAERRDQLLLSAKINDRIESGVSSVRRSPAAPSATQTDRPGAVGRGRPDADRGIPWHGHISPEPGRPCGGRGVGRGSSSRRRRRIPRTGAFPRQAANESRPSPTRPSQAAGRLRTEQDERELRSRVRQLRHQAKHRGLLAPNYNRRIRAND